MSTQTKTKKMGIIDAIKVLFTSESHEDISLPDELTNSIKKADKMGIEMVGAIVEEKIGRAKSKAENNYSQKGLDDFTNRLKGINKTEINKNSELKPKTKVEDIEHTLGE